MVGSIRFQVRYRSMTTVMALRCNSPTIEELTNNLAENTTFNEEKKRHQAVGPPLQVRSASPENTGLWIVLHKFVELLRRWRIWPAESVAAIGSWRRFGEALRVGTMLLFRRLRSAARAADIHSRDVEFAPLRLDCGLRPCLADSPSWGGVILERRTRLLARYPGQGVNHVPSLNVNDVPG